MMLYDVIILGAGAAGMMCAAVAGQRGKRVLLLDHAEKLGEKIRISGGGRCNFTNIHTSPKQFLSENPHFCASALARYQPEDFCQLLRQHRIGYHEKTLGQLFCDDSAQQIITMLLEECAKGGVQIIRQASLQEIRKTEAGFHLEHSRGNAKAAALVVATGGRSIPKIGATGVGYAIAEQFGIAVVPQRAALVPFTLPEAVLNQTKALAGVAVPDAIVSTGKQHFREAMLWTHRGISGPALLQLSSYWQEGRSIQLNLMPDHQAMEWLKQQKQQHPKQEAATSIATMLPRRLAQYLASITHLEGKKLADIPHKALAQLAEKLNSWSITPNGTEGYRTAEVTLGGVDTRALSSQTMMSLAVPGLYFIGEVVDVTGHLGGYNFQWAWASAQAAGKALAAMSAA